jgi:hypothetical protein
MMNDEFTFRGAEDFESVFLLCVWRVWRESSGECVMAHIFIYLSIWILYAL